MAEVVKEAFDNFVEKVLKYKPIKNKRQDKLKEVKGKYVEHKKK